MLGSSRNSYESPNSPDPALSALNAKDLASFVRFRWLESSPQFTRPSKRSVERRQSCLTHHRTDLYSNRIDSVMPEGRWTLKHHPPLWNVFQIRVSGARKHTPSTDGRSNLIWHKRKIFNVMSLDGRGKSAMRSPASLGEPGTAHQRKASSKSNRCLKKATETVATSSEHDMGSWNTTRIGEHAHCSGPAFKMTSTSSRSSSSIMVHTSTRRAILQRLSQARGHGIPSKASHHEELPHAAVQLVEAAKRMRTVLLQQYTVLLQPSNKAVNISLEVHAAPIHRHSVQLQQNAINVLHSILRRRARTTHNEIST